MDMAGRSEGREVLGAVAGRPEQEDVEIGIDRVCDDLLEAWCRRSGLSFDIHSEHGLRRVDGTGERYLIATDPFDGSGLFSRGLPAEWWSVLSIYTADLTPVAGGAVDIIRRQLYLADENNVTVTPLDGGSPQRIQPPSKTALDDSAVIAAFLMEPSYFATWAKEGSALLTTLIQKHPGARIWPNGGSCIYPWLAQGKVHAYVMFNEPRSEVDPGLAFASAAGYPVVSVLPDGSFEAYRFEPGKTAGRVPLLVAACTEDMARSVIDTIFSR
ncbi:MAG: fructose-1,6-bisphosphatase [Chloroflexi bacterium]|jgi:fructose-1,6-bisphosphatase/inositol monophosphatase family enzyme|nr:MAG: fructose-1,6-bisphosphatase [Chloroflexota bacterium]